MAIWMLEQRITCPQCNTRLEEWDPEKGGDINAYYPQTFIDPGCKVIHDAYDAERENSKDADGVPHMNGVRVRLVPKEVRMREVAERRRKKMKEEGKEIERRNIPFYPFR